MATELKDVLFDGNQLDLDRVFAACAMQFIADPSRYSDDSTKCAHLLSRFRGPALDWAARRIDQDAALNGASYADLCNAVKAYYGYDRAQAAAVAASQLGVMRLQGDLLEFLVSFDDACTRAGIASDVSKIAILLPKLHGRYARVVTDNGSLPTRYSTVRGWLTNAYALSPENAAPDDEKRKKSRCKKCGKRGHTAVQCDSKN